jgi:hypothetical protein
MTGAKLSQRTLVRVMDALDTVPYKNRFRFLYGNGLPDWFVTRARVNYQFNWDQIIISLRNTRFFFPSNSHFGILGQYQSVEDAQLRGEAVIRKLAAIAASLPNQDSLENSLQLDGYAIDKEQLLLVPLEGPVNAQAEEDALTALLRTSGLPNAATVEQHIKDANELFVQGRPHASLNESRNMLQALIDGISTETHQNRVHSRGFPRDTAGRILYLKDVAFFTTDEHDAFKSAWHALSAGSHPGVPAREEARIGLVLALEFSQLLLLKCANWSKNGYKTFSP